MSEITPKEKIDYLYEEYVRLSNRVDSVLDSSWDDFKMLGALSAVGAWPVVEDQLDNSSNADFLLFAGFIAILFVILVLGLRDFIKQFLIAHYIAELQSYEHELREKLALTNSETLRFAEYWVNSKQKRLERIVSNFYIPFYAFLMLFPTGVLAATDEPTYAGMYFAVALVALVFYLSTLSFLRS